MERIFIFRNSKTGETKPIKAKSEDEAWDKLESTLPDNETTIDWKLSGAQG